MSSYEIGNFHKSPYFILKKQHYKYSVLANGENVKVFLKSPIYSSKYIQLNWNNK